jgi:hypothetical protein
MAYAATKEEGCDANGTQIPLLWSELIETGLAEVQQVLEGKGAPGLYLGGGRRPPPPERGLPAGPLQTLGAVISKRWLHVDHSGIPTLVEVDKHRVVQELGIRWGGVRLGAWRGRGRNPSPVASFNPSAAQEIS